MLYSVEKTPGIPTLQAHFFLVNSFKCVSPYLNPQVPQNLGKDKFSPQSFEQVGTRIAKVLEKVSALNV